MPQIVIKTDILEKMRKIKDALFNAFILEFLYMDYMGYTYDKETLELKQAICDYLGVKIVDGLVIRDSEVLHSALKEAALNPRSSITEEQIYTDKDIRL